MLERARAALASAREALLTHQLPDGGFLGHNRGGPMYTAITAITEAHIGVLTRGRAADYCASMLADALPDGGYAGAPLSSTMEPTATALVHAGLLACGLAPDDPPVRAAWNIVIRSGGVARTQAGWHIFLAMGGTLPATALPSPVLLYKLIPGFQRFLGSRVGLELVLVANELPVIVRRLLERAEPCPSARPVRWLHEAEEARVQDYLERTQNDHGNWAGILMSTLLGVAAYDALGVSRESARFQLALGSMERWRVPHPKAGIEVLPYTAEIWNTAEAVRVLLEAGHPRSDSRLVRAVDFLIGTQTTLDAPADWQNPGPLTPRSGGWPYEIDNPLCSDCDTTGAVLAALGTWHGGRPTGEHAATYERGLAWLLGMVNVEGGWPAFSHGLAPLPKTPIFTRPIEPPSTPLGLLKLLVDPPPELGDPATPELTGRVLLGLGRCGFTVADPVVRRAVDFCRELQSEHMWWGRWEVNYLAATSCVLTGLAEVGVDMTEPWVQRAVTWLRERQNQDGGFGEDLASYREPALAGRGPSVPTLTADVLSALVSGGVAVDDPAVLAAVDFLLAAQRRDGLWDEPQALYVMVPPDFFYANFVTSQCPILAALAKWVRLASAHDEARRQR